MSSLGNLPDTAALQALDAAHHLHAFTDTAALNAKGTQIVTGADGSWLTTSEGHQLIDGMAGLWCVNVGYGRNEIVEAASRQMQALPYYNTFFQSSNPPVIELSALLARLMPEHINRTFYTLGGSDANDTVYKLARVYWQCKGEPDRKIIISRKNAYHGSTVVGAALGGMDPMHANGGDALRGVVHINQPYYFREGGDMTIEEFGLSRAQELEAAILEHGPENVAAFIGEPIQGAGGVIIPPDNYWPEIQRICQKYDILLCVDEVICGFGRTGEWFGCDTFNITADMITMAKGITSGYAPLGAVGVSDKVADIVSEKGGVFAHGYTYSGHPVSCAAAVANLQITEREKLPQRVKDDIGPYLQQRWKSLEDHPLVGEARIQGLFGALELVQSKNPIVDFETTGAAGVICRDYCLENGLVIRAVRDMIIICPPLTLTMSEADELVGRARSALDKTLDHLTRLKS